MTVALLIILGFLLYTYHAKNNPPGFQFDESSIGYNAFTIAQTGRDEHGAMFPLYFRAFGEYKNPTYIYLLAGLFRLFGPSIAVARLLSGTCGFLACVLLGLLAFRLTRNMRVCFAVTISALLTPWLFECSREVFEVSLYPLAMMIFLLALRRAASERVWTHADALCLAATLALLTYSYSIGRLFAPLLAFGLILFIRRGNFGRVLLTLALYTLTLIPLLLFNSHHPGALTARFYGISYVTPQSNWREIISPFVRHYLLDINPWRMLVTGEVGNFSDHIQGVGVFPVASFLLAIIGICLIIKRERRDAWWQFIIYALAIAVIPAALTISDFPQLRLILVPVLLEVLTIPAWSWLLVEGEQKPKFARDKHVEGDDCSARVSPFRFPSAERLSSSKRRMIAYLLAATIILQGAYFLALFHRGMFNPERRHNYDAEYEEKIFLPALATGLRPIYLDDPSGIRAGYMQAFWYAALHRVPATDLIYLPHGERPPTGALVITPKEEAPRGRILSQSPPYTLYIADNSISERDALAEDLRALPEEYQRCGYLIYRLYKVALARAALCRV